MKKALFVASVASMIDQFNLPNIRLLQDMGAEVDVACNFVKGNTCPQEKVQQLLSLLDEMSVNCYQVDFDRHTSNVPGHIKAYSQMCAVLEGRKTPVNVPHHEGGGYAFVHCHSPIGGVVGRIAARKHGVRTLYTAHGFHFYTGAPLVNWLMFYPIEKALARVTDALITINREDYERALRNFSSGRVYYVPGIGIDLQKFHRGQIDIEAKRAELGVGASEILMLSVGELIPRKGHETVIRALGRMGAGTQNVQYLICGTGGLHDRLSALIHHEGLDGRIGFLGFRTDISELCQAADLFVFPSRQEGLPVALMEAIACKTPALCSDIRGNRDLVQDRSCLFQSGDVKGLTRILQKLTRDGRNDLHRIIRGAIEDNYERLKKFDLHVVEGQMREIYAGLLSS